MANHRDPRRERTWRQHLRRQQASGLNVRDYCSEHELAESSFYFWKRTIAQRDREAPPTVPAAVPKAVPAFVPVTVIGSPARESSVIDIRLAGGHRLRVRAGCDRDLLAAVVAVLEGQPC